MPRTGRPAERRIAAVERAVAVLDALAAGELGTNEVARRLGVDPSSASRQLATLTAHGLVEHVADTGRYRLGLRLVELGNLVAARLDLRELARPHLRALVDGTGETATLSLPAGRDAVTVDFVQSPRSVRSVAEIGRPSIGHATATGKIVLAFREEGGSSARTTHSPALQGYTERTIVDRRALRRELDRVREQGYARAVDEREPGLAAVAAPVRGRGGELVAVLGVQGPSERFRDGALDQAVALLRDAVAGLSRLLGGP